MNAIRILFKTGRFNLSKVSENFINPCCFGEDLAAWLRQELVERQVWELPANIDGQSYYLCVSGNAEETNAKPDAGEWGIIVEKKRSIFQRITGKGKITRDDGMLGRVSKILEGEPTIRGVHLEELR